MTFKNMFQLPAIALALVALSVLSSCGGSGGGGSATPVITTPSLAMAPVDYVAPDNGASAACCAVEFALRNGSPSKYTGGVYRITVYDDKAGLTTLALSGALAEDANGEVRWTPSLTLVENRAYWWKWEAQYKEGNVTSAQGVFYVPVNDGLKAIAPRHTGWMDANLAAKPTFAVINTYTGAEASVSYDFELYSNESLSALVASVAGLPQENSRYTTWLPTNMSAALNNNANYYWRVRANLNGVATGWAGPYSFTVQNPCSVTGDQYASYAVDWIVRKQCPLLLMTDQNQALGFPDAHYYPGSSNPWRGFISMSDGGELVVEVGATVVDQPGPDIRVHQFVSEEPIEVLVGPTEVGPWYSLGTAFCSENCDFDLASAGVAYTRYVKIRDLTSPMQTCHTTAGADIDSVQWIQPTSDTGSCATFGGQVSSPTVSEAPAPITHSVPDWMKGLWRLIEIDLGSDYSSRNLTFTVTDTGFEYSYPGCYVKGRLSMDPRAMMTAASAYTMVMDEVLCPQQWDFSTYTGKIDIGYFFAMSEGMSLYRTSFYSSIDMWVYVR